jgi:exosortase E/protease (VPEID-CTERM system)
VSIYVAPLGLVLLLVIEVLGLTLAFDTQRLDFIPTVWAQLVNASPQALRLISSVLLTTITLAALNRPRELRQLLAEGGRGGFRLPRAALHLASLAAFAVCTSIIVATGGAYLAHPELWTLAWLVAGGLTFATWAELLWPISTWRGAISITRASLAAGAVIGTTAWLAGYATQEFWVPLARYTMAVVTWMLRFFYTDTVSVPARLMVGTRGFKVAITPQCSGYEGVGLILTFLTVYLWAFRRELRFPAALLLLPLGAVLMWLANAVRIAVLIAIGTAGWKAVAIGGFHSQAGWIAFSAISLGFVALLNRSGYFRQESAAPEPVVMPPNPDPTTAYLGPFFVITATAMLTGAMSSGFDWLYPLRLITVGIVLWSCRRHYAGLRWSCTWWSVAIGAATFLFWIALVPASPGTHDNWPAALRSIPLGWAAAWLLLRSIGYIVMAPLAEELAFRGFLMRRLTRADFQNLPLGRFSWWAFAVSSVLFGALHGSLWLPGTIAGMSFGLALYRRGALGDAIWAHATTNGLIALYAWTTGQWSVWS